MSSYEIGERLAPRIAAAVHAYEQRGGGVANFERGNQSGRPVFARLVADLTGNKWSGKEARITADGAGFEDLPNGRTFDASTRPLWSVGPPPVVGQVVVVFQVAFKRDAGGGSFDNDFALAFEATPPRVTRRITGNADFGAALWDGSTVGTDEMWEEYAELNLATGRYEKKARKLFGACP